MQNYFLGGNDSLKKANRIIAGKQAARDSTSSKKPTPPKAPNQANIPHRYP
jgi:hypothetical protein